MNQSTLSYLIRSAFIVLATVAVGMALSQKAGLTIKQAVLLTLPIGFFAASLMTMLFMALEGEKGNPNKQLIILLVIEFLLVPIASAAAITAYFADQSPPTTIEAPGPETE